MTEIILQELKYLIGILVAVVLGFAIGFERKLRYKEAGIRTHTIVCVGAALIKELFSTEHFNRLTITRDGDATVYHAIISTDKEYSSQTLNEIMTNNQFILSIERYDEE